MAMHSHEASALIAPNPAAIDESTAVATEPADSTSPCGGNAGDRAPQGGATADCTGTGACGVMTTQTPPMSALLHPTVRTIAIAAPATPNVGFLTGAPERPPRTLA